MREYGSWPDLVNRPVIMGQYVLASLRDGSKISSELQPLREKQGYQVQEPGDLVESPQFAALLSFSARNDEQFQVPYPEHKGVLCSPVGYICDALRMHAVPAGEARQTQLFRTFVF